MSPREKLIENFKYLCNSNFDNILKKDLSDELLKIKLECYVISLCQYINNNCRYECTLTLKYSSDSISIFNNFTLLNTYTYDNVNCLYTEISLSMALFIEWGNLVKNIKKINATQLLVAL